MTLKRILMLLLMLGACKLLAGPIVQVHQISEPAGIVDTVTECDVDLEMTTVSAPMKSGDYRFCYWRQVLPTYSKHLLPATDPIKPARR